jgi:hypothetical protein
MSLLIPGSAQARLHHSTASMIFAAGEILAIGMARHAGQDLREALAAPDSIITGYTQTDSTPIINKLPSRFTPSRIRARRVHYEDWIAALIFNHLISGADAYVSANLWDFHVNVSPNVSMNPVQKSMTVGANVPF